MQHDQNRGSGGPPPGHGYSQHGPDEGRYQQGYNQGYPQQHGSYLPEKKSSNKNAMLAGAGGLVAGGLIGNALAGDSDDGQLLLSSASCTSSTDVA
jgi:hypothetical protein